MPNRLTDQEMKDAAGMFSALAEVARLRILVLLSKGALSVSAIAAAENEKLTTISARLKLLNSARLVERERKGKTILYRLSDNHVLHLIQNAIEHACEHHSNRRSKIMSDHDHKIHKDHPHEHGPNCGHTAIKHGDHVDYLHDGHLHHPHGTMSTNM